MKYMLMCGEIIRNDNMTPRPPLKENEDTIRVMVRLSRSDIAKVLKLAVKFNSKTQSEILRKIIQVGIDTLEKGVKP